MDVDEARHDEPPGTVDHGFRRSLVAAADLQDLRPVESEILVLQVDMAAALLVVGDDPGGVPDDGDGHSLALQGKGRGGAGRAAPIAVSA